MFAWILRQNMTLQGNMSAFQKNRISFRNSTHNFLMSSKLCVAYYSIIVPEIFQLPTATEVKGWTPFCNGYGKFSKMTVSVLNKDINIRPNFFGVVVYLVFVVHDNLPV